MDNGCAWDARELCVNAAQGGTVEALRFLQQQGIVTSTAMLTDMLGHAALNNKLAAAKWLREQGAEWPNSIEYGWSPWSSEVLDWAVAEGYIVPIDD
jgi:hypothetical protein